MTGARPALWDNRTLPYRPPHPVVLFWCCPHDPGRMRVVVPNHRGDYERLVPGRKYFELHASPVVLPELPNPMATNPPAQGTQAAEADLEPLQPEDRKRYRM